MKAKGSFSLYEVLKSASRPSGGESAGADPVEPPAAPSAEGQMTLQDRLAAYKAAKLAAASAPSPEPSAAAASTAIAVAEATPPPAPAPILPPAPTIVLAPPPPPTPAPAPFAIVRPEPETAAAPDPGERVLHLTYNTALFAGLVVAGLLFVAYALGLHSGKRAAAEAAAPPAVEVPRRAPVAVPAPRPVPPPAPRKEYTLRLAELRYGTSEERLKANALAEDLKKALDKAGFRGLERVPIKRFGEDRLALYMDKFTDPSTEAARARLAAMKAFKFKTATPFSQAAFEEIAPR